MVSPLKFIQLADASVDDLQSLRYARTHWIPRHDDGRPISPATAYRWIRKGVHGVRLQALFSPHGCYTTQEAVRHFLAAVDAARRAGASAGQVIDASESELHAAGLRPHTRK